MEKIDCVYGGKGLMCVCVEGGGGGLAGLGYCKKQSQDFTGDNHQLRKK